MGVNLVYLVLLVACCANAFIRGGAPERIGMAIIAGNAVLTFFLVSAPPIRFQGVEIGVFSVDVLAFLSFVALALRANRFWPIWVSALLGLGVLASITMLTNPRVIPWAYAVVLSIWSYPILLLIAVGTHNHQKRLTRDGADPSWTRSFATPGQTRPPPGPMR